ncbi:MAG: polysaccharide biosynthesis protein [Alphaproteobacteria bacterium]|nr:polysaccharide biosynthesis protein [Alphaproteobacteria bacterium]MBF0128441.1 polysaccharide biosynthesis protein [Alphaproteobacteria bacterium]
MRTPPLKLHRGHIAFLHDLTMAAVSFVLSLYLRLGDSLPLYMSPGSIAQDAALFALVAAGVYWSQNMYRGIWRYASINDLFTITRAVSLVILIFFPLMFLMTRLESLPRSVLVINWFVLMALLGGPRFLYRLFKDRRIDLRIERDSRRRIPVLLAGAGDGAEMFIRSLLRNPDAEYRVVGIVGERQARVGRDIHGVNVMGTIADLPAVVEQLTERDERPQKLIVTREDMDGQVVRELLEEADGLGMTLARLPRLTEFKTGLGDEAEVRPIAIEDLLGRPQAVLDRAGMRALIAGRRVLVTGAGGTIGSELVRQISDFGPAHLALFENSEFNLYSIDMELAGRYPEMSRAAIIGDVRDARRVGSVMARHRPELVFHAAALKHVPMVEANPFEGILTNAHGTRVVADACRAAGVMVMVLISTDKAVNPTSIMGATKRIAESYCQALDALEEPDKTTRFVTVRFGNVLGSTGSVVPLFQKQLAAGGPLTVTHPDIKRYFMTVREAVELVLQTSALGAAERRYQGRIFVLDMGEPVLIADLARQMIRLAGRRPDTDVKIVFTGLRPGEKLFEEIFHGSEPPMPTEREGILVAAPRTTDLEALVHMMNDCVEACRGHDIDAIKDGIRRLVPEYQGDGG